MSAEVTGAIKLRNPSNGDEMFATVLDTSPELEPQIHIEGRKVVQVSIELFIQLMTEIGYYPVHPETDETITPKDYEENNA